MVMGRSSFLLFSLLVTAVPGRALADGELALCVASPVLEDVADLQEGLGRHIAARGFTVAAGDRALPCENVLLVEDVAGLEARRAEASLPSLLVVRRVVSASAGTSSFELWLARAGRPPEVRKATTAAERAARLAGLSMVFDDLLGGAPVAASSASSPRPTVSAPSVAERSPVRGPQPVPKDEVTSRVDPGLDLEAGKVSLEKETRTVQRGADGSVEKVKTSKVGVSASGDKGLGVGFSEEQVERVKEPVDGSTNFGLTLGAGVSLSDTITILTASFALRLRRISGQFPGAEGGTLSALDMAAEAGAMVGKVDVDYSGLGRFAPESESTGFLAARGQLELAYLWTRFQPMDPATLVQSGFGVRLGVMGGAQLEVTRDGSLSPTIGPLLGLEFPTYNAGTAKFSSVSINAIIIPIGGLSAFASMNLTF